MLSIDRRFATYQQRQRARAGGAANGAGRQHLRSLRFVEYTYYAAVFYAVAGAALGVSAPFLGALLMAFLAACCIAQLGPHATAVYRPTLPPVLCAVSSVVVQIGLHHESLLDGYVRSFVTWIPALIVVQALAMRRGFLHRFAVATFGIGLLTLPYARTWSGGEGVERLALDSAVGLSNPNDLAAWFGFCAVYFIVLSIEGKRTTTRMPALLAALASVYVVGLTVSRGKLLAIAVAAVIALRHVLRRGFVPILILVIGCWVVYSLGTFDRIADFYMARGTQETGRLVVWPLAFERFRSSPFIGVGASNISTYVWTSDHAIEPHNGLLHIALASGIGPLVFFVIYWVRASVGVLRAHSHQVPDAPFFVPLLVYSFLVMWIGNATFMFSWMTVSLSVPMAAVATRRRPSMAGRQTGMRPLLERSRSTMTATGLGRA